MTLEDFLKTRGSSLLKESTPVNRKKLVKNDPRKPRKKVVKSATRIDICADFETTTKAEDCRVWSWGYVEVVNPDYDAVVIGQDIASFMETVMEFNSNCYFHNLKFDGRFLLDWLLNNGYTHTKERRNTLPLQFNTLISNMGSFYSITVKWSNGNVTEFRDSLKKLPMSVQRIAKSFDLDTSKGDIDYEAERPIGHVITAEEEDYLRRDIVIVAQAMSEIIASGMKKLTVASDSMAEFKSLTGMSQFDKYFPVFSDDMDQEIRRSYRGGFTYSDDRFRGRRVGKGVVLDVNSLYPSVMKFNLIPYGVPRYSRSPKPTEDRPLTIFSVTFTAKLKPGHIPCIQIKGNNMFIGTEYLREINEPTTLTVTNVDWDLYNDHYYIDVLSYNGGFAFRAALGIFDRYIDKWSEIKASETGGKREIAKLHLNSLYGKFATNPNVTGKYPVLEDGIVKLKTGEQETKPPVYTAAGSFITAYARDKTIRSAQENYEVFAYADTDSLHLLTDVVPDNIDVHPTKLGAWKYEYGFSEAYYIRPKAYMELKNDGKFETRIAGLPTSISSELTFDDLVPGKILHGKLNPRAVPGGVILKDVPFELKLS